MTKTPKPRARQSRKSVVIVSTTADKIGIGTTNPTQKIHVAKLTEEENNVLNRVIENLLSRREQEVREGVLNELHKIQKACQESDGSPNSGARLLLELWQERI